MGKYEAADMRVKKQLSKIMKVEGDWEVMLDILYRRGLQKMLVDRRKSLGLTQEDLAKRLGVTQATISEFETNKWPDPRLSTLRRWMHALDLHNEYVVTDARSPEEESSEVEEDGPEA